MYFLFQDTTSGTYHTGPLIEKGITDSGTEETTNMLSQNITV
jgi:hypothetical protein